MTLFLALSLLEKIQKGEKMNVKHMQIQQDTILTKIFRSFVYNDNRSNTFNFINTSIKKAFEILNMHMESDKQFDKKICQNIINDLRECKFGMINIKDTYMDDLMFCCKMDALIEETDARINDIESKHEYLREVKMD